MALRIHVLTATDPVPNEPFEAQIALWVDVPSAVQPKLADPSATSAVPWATSTDLSNLRAGRIVEIVRTLRWTDPPGPDELLTQLKRYAAQELRNLLAERGVPPPARPALLTRGAVYDDATGTWTIVS